MTLLPEQRARDEIAKLQKMISSYRHLKNTPPANIVEEKCRPIALDYLKRRIHEQIAYLKRWNVEINDETLHGWG